MQINRTKQWDEGHLSYDLSFYPSDTLYLPTSDMLYFGILLFRLLTDKLEL